jgi:hypothetical protein
MCLSLGKPVSLFRPVLILAGVLLLGCDDSTLKQEAATTRADIDFIAQLPQLRADAYAAAQPRWDSGVTAEMVDASEVLNGQLVGWAERLQAGIRHQLDEESRRVYENYWKTEATGGGTVHQVLAAGAATQFLEEYIAELARATLDAGAVELDFGRWLEF